MSLDELPADESDGLRAFLKSADIYLTMHQASVLLGIARHELVRHMNAGQLDYRRSPLRRQVSMQSVLVFRRQRRPDHAAS